MCAGTLRPRLVRATAGSKLKKGLSAPRRAVRTGCPRSNKNVHRYINWTDCFCRGRGVSVRRAARLQPGTEALSGGSVGHPPGFRGGVWLVARMVWCCFKHATARASIKPTSEFKPTFTLNCNANWLVCGRKLTTCATTVRLPIFCGTVKT